MEVAEVKEQENKTVQSTKVASLGKVDRASFSVPNKEDISDTPIENKTVDKKFSLIDKQKQKTIRLFHKLLKR